MMLQCIYQQPNPFEKFVYDSLVRKKTFFVSELVLCYHTIMPKIWIVAELYSQLDPPLLSAHTLRKKDCTKNEKFIVDTMRQVDLNNSLYKYTLHNCHIRKTSRARQRNSIAGKLRELKSWQQLGSPLKWNDKEWIDNTIAKLREEGFTPYVYNEITNCKEQLTNTTFSHAIYDSSEFLTVDPCFGSAAGGSKHVLKVEDCFKVTKPKKVVLSLTDDEESWQAKIIGHAKDDGIHFVVPAYTGNWDYNDGNRLIDVKVLDVIKGLPKSAIKFIYV